MNAIKFFSELWTKKDNPCAFHFPELFKTQNFGDTHLGAQSTPKEVFMEISNYMDFQAIRFLEGLQKSFSEITVRSSSTITAKATITRSSTHSTHS